MVDLKGKSPGHTLGFATLSPENVFSQMVKIDDESSTNHDTNKSKYMDPTVDGSEIWSSPVEVGSLSH